jgi:hypothetical protein
MVAVAEKVSALDTATFFEERAARGSHAKFNAILARVSAVAPRKGDER